MKVRDYPLAQNEGTNSLPPCLIMTTLSAQAQPSAI